MNSAATAIVTTRTVYALNAAGTTLGPVLARANIDAALTLPPKKVALIEGTASGVIRAALVNLATGVAVLSPSFAYGQNKGEIAVAADSKNIAVVARQGIVIYDDAFAQISMIPDVTIAGIRFRPGS